MPRSPNLLFVFGDQWRRQAFGYTGDPNARTPRLDRFAAESVEFTQATSGCPVCTPWRASLLTGQFPLSHGCFVNDVPLQPRGPTFGECLAAAGHATAWIGKWHVDGHGRGNYIPPERQRGFHFWRSLECSHDYWNSRYYADADPTRRYWDGYDARAQTDCAGDFIRGRDPDRPFACFLSWGPPHAPYDTAPPEELARFDRETLALRPNVPPEREQMARDKLHGYYAHGAALDRCFGQLLDCLDEQGIAEETLVVFTSDHGDMLGSQGSTQPKQQPWEESVRIPMLLRWPAAWGRQPRSLEWVLDTPDIMPTILGALGLDIPASVEGRDLSPTIAGATPPRDDSALLLYPFCFHQWVPSRGGREYRGLRTARYTYCIDHDGPWLLYDNQADPCQLANAIDDPAYAEVRAELDARLRRRLRATGDDFRPGRELIEEWGWPLVNGDIPAGWVEG